jgi:hypothetical protein
VFIWHPSFLGLHQCGDLLDTRLLLVADLPEDRQYAVAVDVERGFGALDHLDEVVVELVGGLLVAELVVEDAVEVPAGVVALLDQFLDLVEGDAVGLQFADQFVESLPVGRRLRGGLPQERPDLVVEVARVGVLRGPRLDDLLEDDTDLEEPRQLVVGADGRLETHPEPPSPPRVTDARVMGVGRAHGDLSRSLPHDARRSPRNAATTVPVNPSTPL